VNTPKRSTVISRRKLLGLSLGAAGAATFAPIPRWLLRSRAQVIPLTNVMVTYPLYVTAPNVGLDLPVISQLFPGQGPVQLLNLFNGSQLLVYQAGWQALAAQYGGNWQDLARRFGFANLAQAVTQLAQEQAWQAAAPPPPPEAPAPTYPPGPVPLATYPPPEVLADPAMFFFHNDAVFFAEQLRAQGATEASVLAVLTAIGAASSRFMAGRDVARELWPFLRQGLMSGSVTIALLYSGATLTASLSILGGFLAIAFLVKIGIDLANNSPDGLFGWPFPPGWTELPVTTLDITETEIIEKPDGLIRTMNACPAYDYACQVIVSQGGAYDPTAGLFYNPFTGQIEVYRDPYLNPYSSE
jgi:hypothetical protein